MNITLNIESLGSLMPVVVLVRDCRPDGDNVITRCYSSDVLSDVLAKAPRGSLLLTVQAHPVSVAVAAQAGIPAILYTGGHQPDAETIRRAQAVNIALAVTTLDSFDAAGRLWSNGLRGASA
jgi:hypothetical protein